MQDKIKQAKEAGYTDEQILQYLTSKGLVQREKVQSAIAEGYQPGQIIQYLGRETPPSMGDRVGRQVGLGVRDAVMGLTGLPLMVGDALNAAVNLGIEGVNRVADTSIPKLGRASDAAENLLTQAGLPQPGNRTEQNVSQLNRILTGAGGAKLAADLLAKGGNKLVQAAAAPFQQNLNAQVASGAVSTGAVDVARNEFGVNNPLALGAIGMTAGVGAPSLGTTGRAAGRELVKPFSQQGKEVIVGNVLNRVAQDPQRALQNLDNAAVTVPGSRPTTAAASRDVGLAGSETAIRGLDDSNKFAARIGQNNRARMAELDRIAGTGKLDQAIDKRGRVTAPLREGAFANAQPVDTAPLLANIDSTLASPIGVRSDVDSALRWARSRIELAGNDPARLYEVRKDIAGAMQGKYDKDLPSLRLAKGQLTDVLRAVDQTIESGAPGYSQYMRRFATMSKPIDQMRLLQDITNKTTRGQTDLATGQPVLTASTLRSQIASRSEDIAETLSPTQRRVLDKIVGDIDRGMASTAPGVKVPGSDTFKNMSIGNMIGRMFSEKMADNTTLRTITRPLDWLYKLPDQAITDLLVDAMLDPQLAAQLMRKANVMQVEPVARELRKRAAQMGYGSIVGTDE